jgi:hypothetical protein
MVCESDGQASGLARVAAFQGWSTLSQFGLWRSFVVSAFRLSLHPSSIPSYPTFDLYPTSALRVSFIPYPTHLYSLSFFPQIHKSSRSFLLFPFPQLPPLAFGLPLSDSQVTPPPLLPPPRPTPLHPPHQIPNHPRTNQNKKGRTTAVRESRKRRLLRVVDAR